ncbi:MAG: thioredoxin family protein [Fuerstia sp.]|nr:thioredoxin family protein [Fuerstiella sp.]
MTGHSYLLIVAFCLTHGLWASVASAEDEPVQLKIGDEAPAWAELVGTDDEKHSLADLKDKQVVVVCFTCNSCLYSVDYEDRLIAFHKKFSERKEGVALIAINANLKPAERLDKMKERAKAKEFPFPYLMDETQKVAASYGANFTPEFFVLNKDRRIVYMGAMDDQTQADKVDQRFVELAVEAALKNEMPVTTTNPARGCSIPYKRTKR